jgi:hypothetical protein
MTTTEDTRNPREFGWVMLELMGHRQRIGRAREEDIAGGLMLRIDIPTEGEDYATEYYGASSIYSLRPISEEVAKAHWANKDPRPPRPVTFKPESQIEHHLDEEDDEPWPEDEDVEA